MNIYKLSASVNIVYIIKYTPKGKCLKMRNMQLEALILIFSLAT